MHSFLDTKGGFLDIKTKESGNDADPANDSKKSKSGFMKGLRKVTKTVSKAFSKDGYKCFRVFHFFVH